VYKKKGDMTDIKNYRSIANLCSVSRAFKKLFLNRILEIQETENGDFTGHNQHRFKKNWSTSALSNKIQSQIARAMYNDEYAVLASID
jgi:phage anti-repressor protein